MAPTTQWCIDNFERYRTVRSLFTKYLHGEALKRADAYDRGLHPREWRVGDRVCRKESRGVVSKFTPRNSGPFVIAQILNKHKVVLHKADGEPAFGYPVPMAELVPLPDRQRRGPAIDFEGVSERRSLGNMLTAKEPIAAADAGS